MDPQGLNVLSEDDSDDDEPVLYDLVPNSRKMITVKYHREVSPDKPKDVVRQRKMNEFRSLTCVMFPTPRVPESIVEAPRTREQL